MKIKFTDNRGSALIIALIILVVLSFAASTSIMNSVTNIKIGANYASTIGVFNLAELGIERAKLIAMNASNFDDLLNDSNFPNDILVPEETFDHGSVEVKVTNNTAGANPDSGGDSNDTDGIVVLTSTATGKKGNRVEIETYVGRPTSISFPTIPPSSPSGGGAVGVCGAGPNVKAWGSGNIHGEEYDINGNLIPGSGTYGVVLENAGNIVSKKAGSITGFLGDDTVDSSLPCTEWENLANQLASLGPGPNVLIETGSSPSTADYGTVANPKIVIINTTSPLFKIASNLSGAGVIIVASGTDLQLTGNLDYKGVIILMGDDAYLKTTGSMEHVGYVVLNDSTPDSGLELDMTGNGMMKFSPAAMAVASLAIDGASGGGGGGAAGSQLITYSWAEKY